MHYGSELITRVYFMLYDSIYTCTMYCYVILTALSGEHHELVILRLVQCLFGIIVLCDLLKNKQHKSFIGLNRNV